MFSQKTFAILALAATFLPAALAWDCTLGCQYYQDGKWEYVSKQANIGDTIYILGGSTTIGANCVPASTSWHNAKIYSYSKN
ncbi:hypothetical protein LX32DRAFT_645507 [Colletotrichum zoysiae]|uniref:MAX effector domain-containing protein n=1 Tax=Colletotrichum zoysiae TaxID=1216348 RepID=A0AAD9H5D9_9PEZI|nr:hypothetical protein LX32DRAFT_645507 [Colletotrichum zoysiae]